MGNPSRFKWQQPPPLLNSRNANKVREWQGGAGTPGKPCATEAHEAAASRLSLGAKAAATGPQLCFEQENILWVH